MVGDRFLATVCHYRFHASRTAALFQMIFGFLATCRDFHCELDVCASQPGENQLICATMAECGVVAKTYVIYTTVRTGLSPPSSEGIIATLARLYKAMKSIKNKSQRNQGLPDGNLLTNGVSPAALSPYRQVSTGTVLPRYDAPIILHAEVVSPPATATLMS
jgi:hypothetical protein